jgi:hypothetical protein
MFGLRLVKSWIVIVSLIISTQPGFAQISFAPTFSEETFSNTPPNRPAEFIYQTYKGEELISIRLLGSVQRAGLYHVPKNMNVTTLLSLAGGTSRDADLRKITITNELRQQHNPLHLNLEQTFESGSGEAYQLQTNDLVFVAERRPFISNDTWKAISIISVVLTSALTAIAINDRL